MPKGSENIMSFECNCRLMKLHSSTAPKACVGCTNCKTSLARKGDNHVKLEDHIFVEQETPRGKALVCSECGKVDANSYLKLIQ